MAITHRAFVIITFPLCCVSIALLATSLATQNWLESKAVSAPGVENIPARINYGLFTGSIVKEYVIRDRFYDLRMTCLADLSICALSCLDTQEKREAEIRELYNTNGSASLTNCEAISRQATVRNIRPTPVAEVGPRAFEPDPTFINMGVWGSTIAFIALALLMATLGAVFAVINAANTPVEQIFGILGLFIWNSCAFVSILVAMVLWGCHFGIDLISNAALSESINGQYSTDGLATLGFSYWILIGAAVIHVANVVLLLVRRHMVLHAPPPPTIELKDDNDGAIFLY